MAGPGSEGPRLVTSYLGGYGVQVDDAPVALGSRRTDALFAYLAHTSVPHSRDHLAALLWEPGNPGRSAGNLRVLLTNLRRHVGDFVEITRTSVAFRGGPRTLVDSAAFLDLAGDAMERSRTRPHGDEGVLRSLREAAAMPHGDLLSRLDLSDATDFDHWLRDERARVHQTWAEVLARLVEIELRTGDFAAAAQHAGLLIRVVPWEDLSHQLMIRARRGEGDDAGALRHFEMFDRQHRAEFGTPAARSTRDLVADLVHHDGPVAPARNAPTGPTSGDRRVRQPWSRFTGRRRELGMVLSRYAEASAGRGNVVVVQGAAGTGKTALVRRAVHLLADRDPAMLVMGGAGEDVAGSGHGDLLVEQLLAQRLGETAGGWFDGPMSPLVAERVRALAGYAPTSHEPAGGSSLVRLVRTIRDLARQQPVLLVIDDFQWTSPLTRNLVAELVRGIQALPLCLLVATQPASAAADAAVGGPAWLLDRVGETVGRVVIDLDSDAEERGRASFVTQVLATESHVLPDRVSVEVERLAGGHPLITLELLRDLVRRGQVTRDRHDQLSLTGSLAWPELPDRVVRLLERQLAGLPADTRLLLDAAAVHGPAFDFGVAARAVDVPLHEAARVFGRTLGMGGRALVRSLEAAQAPLTASAVAPTHRFRHPVLREHLVARLDRHERDLLRKLVLDAGV